MKIESLELNITALKNAMGASLKVEDIKRDLIEYGAVVRGYKDDQNRIIMEITGDIDIEDVESVFGIYGVDVNEFIIDEEDFIPDYDEYDDVEVFDNKNTRRTAHSINEKKSGCCPKKKNMINLAEALIRGKRKTRTADLDTIIDNITGKHITEGVANSAIRKAKKESTKAYLIEHLDERKYKMIWESLEAGKKSLYENVKINKKSIAEYTKDQLVAIRQKVMEKISALEGVAGEETELARNKKLSSILEDEISFRTANAMLSEDDAPNGLEFKDLNPNSTKSDVSEEDNADDSKDENSDENSDKESDKESDEKNPDEDEEVEIGSIIITLASKQAAEDLAQDLYNAGVPEDAVEIEPAKEEEEEEEGSDETEEKSDEENTDQAEEEKPEESVKFNGSRRVNEADEEETEDSEKNTDDNTEEGSEEGSEEETEGDGPYKLILTNTDYINELSDVLENIWGMSHEEFEELIGGEIVSSDDDENKEDGEESSKESADDMDFDPEEVFKDL